MPIYLAQMDTELSVKRITGTDKVKKHLENIGIVLGSKGSVVSKVNENIIIKVKGAKIALSHELAKRIMV